MSDDPYTDDEYDSSYKDVHGDEPPKDRHTGDEVTDESFFPSGGSLLRSGRGLWPGSNTVNADYDGTASETTTEKGVPSARMEDAERGTADAGRAETADSAAGDEDGTWLDEGLITLTLVIGVVLFLFPEPATSAIGMALVAVGLVAWVADRLV